MRQILSVFVVFLLLVPDQHAAAAVIQPVIFVGDGLTIVHDGSQTMYNPHTESGRLALRQTRESCCVEAPDHYRGRSEPFAFNADAERHLQHETQAGSSSIRTQALSFRRPALRMFVF